MAKARRWFGMALYRAMNSRVHLQSPVAELLRGKNRLLLLNSYGIHSFSEKSAFDRAASRHHRERRFGQNARARRTIHQSFRAIWRTEHSQCCRDYVHGK